MKKSLPCTEEELSEKYDRYGAMLFRMCMVILCNRQDAEDAVQDTFAKYIQKRPEIHDPEHEKAWLIKVAENRCKDKCRAAASRRNVSVDSADIMEYAETPDESIVMDKIAKLPPRCRSVMFLHYVEGYKIREISKILRIRDNSVKTALYRARKIIKVELEKELA